MKYSDEYVEALEEAARRLSHEVEIVDINGLSKEVRKSNNEALVNYYQVLKDFDNT